MKTMRTDKVKEVSLSRIVAHQEVQARVAMNEETIEEYSEAMRNGDKFPPVVVFTDDGAFYWLADGFHRYHAAKQIANKWSLQAEIRDGGKREAILFAVGANASHGRRRSREDKRNSVLKLLNDKDWSQWSDREIARRCQVSPDTVNCRSSKGCGQIRYEIKRGFLPAVYPFSSLHAILKEQLCLLRNHKVSFLICSRLLSISRFLP